MLWRAHFSESMPSDDNEIGYDLAWLQNISLTGLQKLARAHGIDDDQDVPDLIEQLHNDWEDDEYDDDDAASAEEEAAELEDEEEEEEEEQEEEDDDEELTLADYLTAEDVVKAKAEEPVVATEAAPIELEAPDVEMEDAAYAENYAEAPPEAVADTVAATATTATGDNSAARVASQAPAGESRQQQHQQQQQPWTAAPFKPAKSSKPPTQPHAFANLGSARDQHAATATDARLKASLAAAQRKKEEDRKQAEAAAARREAAAARREKRTAALKAERSDSTGPARKGTATHSKAAAAAAAGPRDENSLGQGQQAQAQGRKEDMQQRLQGVRKQVPVLSARGK